MAGNMESILFDNDDDSSSGESDTEVAVGAGTSAVAAAVQATAPPPAAAPAPAPAVPSGGTSNPSQSEISQRLKSLYSPAAKQHKAAAAAASSQTATAATSATAPSMPTAPAPQQRQSSTNSTSQKHQPQKAPVQQQPPPQQQRHLSSSQHSRPTVATSQQQRPSTQQQPQAHQQHRGPNTSSAGVPSPIPVSHPQQQPSRHHAAPAATQRSTSSGHHRVSQQAPPQQPHSSRPAVTSHDPYEPTPVHKIIERHQQKTQRTATVAPTTSTTRPTTTGSTGTASTVSRTAFAGSSSSQSRDRAAREREMKKQKEKFIFFTRVLLKYLENKDPAMGSKARAIIKDCADRNKRHERGYESVTASMRTRLKAAVGDQYWKRAEAYMEQFLRQKKAQAAAAATGGSDKAEIAARLKAQQREKLRKMEQAKKLQQQQALQKQQQQEAAAAAAAVAAAKRNSMGSTASANSKKATTASSKAKATKRRGSTTPQPRKTSMTPATSASAAAAAGSTATTETAKVPEQPVVREYSEMMEMVHHAVTFDWTTAGFTLGPASPALDLSDEQHKLLYTAPPTAAATSATPTEPAFPVYGWGTRNVVSARNAWARLRLREYRAATTTVNPKVGGGVLSLPAPAHAQPKASSIPPLAVWHNEEHAEQDAALAVLSEGVQMYLTTVLEKALHCARQRQNLDGIRLWHEQCVAATESDEDKDGNREKPALSLRLGCDVTRQFAQVTGNAAMVVQRMEDALDRQTGHLPTMTSVETCTSMADLSVRLPELTQVDAEVDGKRSFEVYGGKDALDEPPLGRVPKRAKLLVGDFVLAQNLAPRRQRAAVVSSMSFSF